MTGFPGGPNDKSGRAHDRYAADWRVTLKCPDWRFAAKVAAANASRGGLFLLTSRPPEVGAVVALTVELPDGTKLAVTGTVQHVVTAERAAAEGRSPGIGVRIDPKHASDLLLLEQMAKMSETHQVAPARSPDNTPSPIAPYSISAIAAHVAPKRQVQGSAVPPVPAAPPLRAASAPVSRPLPVPPAVPPAVPPRARETSAPMEIPPLDLPMPPLDELPSRRTGSHVTPLPVAPSSPPANQAPQATTRPAPRRFVLPKGDVARAVGIDFGTSYTSLSVGVGSTVILMPDDNGMTLQPSIVSYPQGQPQIVGWAARELLVKDARRTVPSAKRLLGRSYSDPTVGGYLQSASYKTLAGPNDSILIEVDRNQYAVPQVCAHVIAHIRDIGERRLGTTIKEVVMSCPVTFTEIEKSALRRAAQLAGLEVIGLIEEPIAGALAYGYGQGKNEIVAVYDFGGGTFDFTVLDVSGDRFRLLASEGDAWLGGDDFDLAVAQAVADAFWRATKIELRQRVVEWQRLLWACEAAKRTLSMEPIAQIVLENLVEAPRRIDLRQKLERAIFERLCQELFDRSLAVSQAALDRAGLDPSDVTQLVVTGGVSHIPFVRKGLEKHFEREITAVVNPEAAIALGAGLRAASLVHHPARMAAREGET